MRVCHWCGSNFETSHSHKKYCQPSCYESGSHRTQYLRSKSEPRKRCESLMAGIRSRTKAKNLLCDVDANYLFQLWEQHKGCCCISGLTFNLAFPEKKGEPRFDSPSVDRIAPDKGYVKGNIRLIIYQLNMAIGPYGLERLLKTMEVINGRESS